jgi:glycosyltransferase involved in cell wall biosynthesis
MKRDVSVIIPAYNRADILKLVVESVLAQTCPVSEIIIVDDGSTDKTSEVVGRAIEEKRSWRERVRYIYQENHGISGALNTGISQARGEWIGFTAQDDLWLPWKLDWQFRALEKYTDCGLCFTDAWFMNNPYMKMTLFEFAQKRFQGPAGKIEDPVKLVVGKHPVWTQTMIARTELVRAVGGLDTFLRYSEDHDFLFRMGLATKFCYVGMPMVLIDRSPADIRHLGEARNWHKEEFRLQMDQYRFEKQQRLGKGLDAAIQGAILKNLRSIHSAWANWYAERGDFVNARRSLTRALEYGVTTGLAMKWLLFRIAPELVREMLARDSRKFVRYDKVSWQLDEANEVPSTDGRS